MTKEERNKQLIRRGVIAGVTTIALASVITIKISKPNEIVDAYESCDADPKYYVVQQDREVCSEMIDPAERELLAKLIYAEAGTCSEQTQYYVGSVVLNRMKDSSYPDTMTEVIYQVEPTVQYGCTVDGNIDKEPITRTYEIADDLLRYGSIAPSNVVFQSEYIQGTGTWKSIDGIYFCYK